MGSSSASGRRVNVKSVIFMAREHILSSNDFSGVGNRCRDDRVPVLVVPRGDFEDDLTAVLTAVQCGNNPGKNGVCAMHRCRCRWPIRFEMLECEEL